MRLDVFQDLAWPWIAMEVLFVSLLVVGQDALPATACFFAGVSALADHIPRYATTIIRLAVDHPLVIVSTRPARACAAATRIARLVRPPLPTTTASSRPRTSGTWRL